MISTGAASGGARIQQVCPVPRSAAMKLVGHKTQTIYSRYAIADERMLKEGAR
jgi:hypothetical protein